MRGVSIEDVGIAEADSAEREEPEKVSDPAAECEECEVLPPLPDELREAARNASQLSYSQRVDAAFVSFIAFYSKLHAGHELKASELSPEMRKERAEEAVELSIEMQRAFLALIGTTHRRRTHAHDFVYGLHQLFMVWAKPWECIH